MKKLLIKINLKRLKQEDLYKKLKSFEKFKWIYKIAFTADLLYNGVLSGLTIKFDGDDDSNMKVALYIFVGVHFLAFLYYMYLAMVFIEMGEIYYCNIL